MAVLSIMMMFSFAAAADCTGPSSTECEAKVCCKEGKLTVFGACDLAAVDATTAECRTTECSGEEGDAANTCMKFKELNDTTKADLVAVLINSTTHTDKKMMTELTMEQIVAAATKSIMSPEDHLAVAEFQQGKPVCTPAPAADDSAATEGEDAADGICPSNECCGVPTLSSCLEDTKCNCDSFCMEDQHEDIIAAYAKVTKLSAIIVLQQKALSFVNGTDATNLGALLEGLSDEQKTMLVDENSFFSNAATLGSFALVLAMVVNF